jgi:predicted glutamine amidotransferase
MCRLLAIIGKIDKKTESKILEEFRYLSKYGYIAPEIEVGHPDGWGMVAYEKNKICYIKKSIFSAYQDRKYLEAIDSLGRMKEDILMAHLRRATVGDRNIKNVHPFIFDNFTFCQNGTILGSNKIPLASKYKKLIQGKTDSEKAFFLMMQKINLHKNKSKSVVQKSILNAVNFIKNNFDYTAFNFILSDGKNVWAMRNINNKNALVIENKLTNYYSLFLGINENSNYKVVASEKIKIQGVSWKLLRNDELLEI